VPLLVMILPDLTQRLDAHYPYDVIHRAVTAWGAELGVETVDLMPLFGGRDHRQLILVNDGHPNAAAHEIFAACLRDRLVAHFGSMHGEAAGAGGRLEPAGERR
jgi:hypothetical protein